jgi:NADPH:quinone reductase
MKAVYISEFTGPDGLEIREVPEPPPPGPNEVLVRVGYAGLNRADLLQARGLYPPPEGCNPLIPGLEFAGQIAALGDGVTGLAEGERVFGITAGEAQAEFVIVDQRLLTRVPEIAMHEAAAVPEAYSTAHDALISQAGLERGETVLIHAIASGVGLAAAQIAMERGARVIGTSRSAEKLTLLWENGKVLPQKPLGLIDTSGDAEFANKVLGLTEGEGADIVLDLVGGAYFHQNIRSLAVKGRLMLVGLVGGRKAEFDLGIALQKRLTLKGTVLRSRPLEEKAAVIAGFERDIVPKVSGSGPLMPVVDRIFELNDVREAYRYLESDRSIGKIILSVSGD